MSSTKFNSIRIDGWRQFGHVDIELHPRLTVLTGENGVGKSSLLRILHKTFWCAPAVSSTPVRQPDGGYSYLTGLFTDKIAQLWSRLWVKRSDMSNIGAVKYENGVDSELQIPTESNVEYNIKDTQPAVCSWYPYRFTRSNYTLSQVGHIPTTIVTPQTAYDTYNSEVENRYQGGHTGYSPAYRMKEAIIAMAMFGEGNSHVQGNKQVLKAYQGFVQALRTMLPESLGFLEISVRPPEVVVVTETGEFIIDAASGGVMTLIDLTWRLYMFSQSNKEFVVTIDEPENHLHPTMQRTVMRRLLKTFRKHSL